jgi:hypothetical protein
MGIERERHLKAPRDGALFALHGSDASWFDF